MARDLRKLRQIAAAFPQGSINIFDAEYRYLVVGGEGLRTVGLKAPTLVGRSLWDLFPRPSVEAVDRHYRRAFAGERVTFLFHVFERYYYICAAPYEYEGSSVQSIVAVAVDVTDIAADNFDAFVEQMRRAVTTAKDLGAALAES